MVSRLTQSAKQMDAMLVFLFSKLKLTTPRFWGLTLLIWASAIVPARAASVDMRVAIEQDAPQVNVGSSVNAQVLDGARRPIGEIQGMNGFAAQPKNGGVALDRWLSGAIWIVPKDKNGVVWIGDRWYRGTVQIVPTGKGLTAINYVDLEQYLYSVLGAEMSGNWPQEALKAQAVAARSYALHERQNARGLFDLGDTAGWQVYNGVQAESVGTQQAVAATTGQVLAYKNEIINAVFHSNAGGCTENVEDVWTQPLPYLRTTKNNFDEGTSVSQWSTTISATDLGNRLGIGTVRDIKILDKTPVCNRVKKIQIIGDRGVKEFERDDAIRNALGLKSSLFTITPQYQPVANKNNAKPVLSSITINGRGFGHGLGMSQWGAYNMARQGATYDRILQEYYKNTQIRPIAPQ